MKMFSEDIIILKELNSKKKIELYELHKKYKLSPAQILRSINKFSKKDVIKQLDDSIFLTDFGNQWIFANRDFIFMKKFEYISRYDETLYKIEKIEENSLYKPIIKIIDSRILKEGDREI